MPFQGTGAAWSDGFVSGSTQHVGKKGEEKAMSIFGIYFLSTLAGLLVIGAIVIAVLYVRAITAAYRNLDRLGSRVIETACGAIEYARLGEGYPVLMVHGAFGGFDQGLWLARTFNVPNFQFICVSRCGYLRSPVPPGADLNLQADVFASLLDSLGIQQAAVFGVSAGSTAAIRFVARHPERVSALVLIGPDIPGETVLKMPPRFVFDKLGRSDFAYWFMKTFFARRVQIMFGMAPKGYPITPEGVAMVKGFQASAMPVSRRMDGIVFETYTIEKEYLDSVTTASPYPLDKIQTPTLVINALDDPLSIPVNVRLMAGKMPNASLFVLPEGGHFLFGHKDEARTEIARFLDRILVEKEVNNSMEATK
jgi:pimeloyl-ACP methyl ester carboxylesterase